MAWFSISASEKPPKGVSIEPARYTWGVHGLTGSLADRVERAYDGAQWLKQRFPAGTAVRVDLRVQSADEVSVGTLRTKSHGGRNKDIICPVAVPSAWFQSGHGDGVLAIQMLRAVLQGLHSVGDRHELGPLPLRSPASDPGKPAAENPFAPRSCKESPYERTASELREIVADIMPNFFVLAATETADRRMADAQRTVAQALGVMEKEDVLIADGHRGVKVWQIRHEA
jgi:hypothetical protein